MRTYFVTFLNEFSFPQEAKTVLVQAYDNVQSHEEARNLFSGLIQRYSEDKECDFQELLQCMKQISAQAGIHEYTGYMVLLICMSEVLGRYYEEAGIDRAVFVTSMCDLKWKLTECHLVNGIWGTFVPAWYRGFFKLNLFGFEKLQFEVISFRREYQKNGVVLTPESKVLNTHIPRTGTKLDPESLRASYRKGAAFFRKHFGMDTPVFVCNPWLLFPKNREVLSPSSNLLRFMSDFEIVEWGEYQDYSQIWRLFDVMYDGNPEHLPQDSSFRRAYVEWIRMGEKTGWGSGIYVYREGDIE